MNATLNKLKIAATRAISDRILKALDEARLQIEAQAVRFVGAKLPPIAEQAPGIAERFTENLYKYFDDVEVFASKDSEIEPDDYDNLSLVDHDYLEAMIAMEGMVKNMHENEVAGFRSLKTRLEALLPGIRVDQNNNPLDPEQIGDSFNEAIRPLGLKAHYLLTIYREFNKSVFNQFYEIIAEANQLLADEDVLPDLDIDARDRAARKEKRKEAREQLEAETRAKEEAMAEELANRGKKPSSGGDPSSAEMFSLMQSLVQTLAERQGGGSGGADSQAAGSAAEQQAKLMTMLTDIQAKLMGGASGEGGEAAPDAAAIGQSVSDSLRSETGGAMDNVSRASSEVINLVTLLYQAIWKDQSLPVAMKELIGRTQISIMKVALSDSGFFENENHPARVLLNELALAGISWIQTDEPENDPAYQKMRELVERMLNQEELNEPFLEELLSDLDRFKDESTGSDASLERRILATDSFSEDSEELQAYVSRKIDERVLEGYLDPAIRNLLDTHMHDFLVKLIVREGPGGPSWKPVMSTIDVLLWTVQADKQPGDRERYERINPRLIDNLEKAMEIGGASKTKIGKAIRHLKQIQEYSFHKAESGPQDKQEQSAGEAAGVEISLGADASAAALPRNDALLRQSDKLPVGSWVEFNLLADQPLRCKLAAKIDSIDKLFFVNTRGQKVGELTRMELAQEIKAGGAKIISSGPLVDRAMRSVIHDLQDSLSDTR